MNDKLTENNFSIHNRIKELRIALKMNQAEFGKKIEVAQGYLTNIETGKRAVTDKILKLICLQEWEGKTVNEDWLRYGNGNMFIEYDRDVELAKFTADLFKSEKDSFKSRFISALAKLNVDEWEVLEKIAVSLIEKEDN